MSGMGDGYVGTAQDAVRIRKLEKQREAERRKIQELKDKSASTKGQPGLLQFGKSRAEVRTRMPIYFLGFPIAFLIALRSIPYTCVYSFKPCFRFSSTLLRRKLWVWLQEKSMLRR